MMACFRCDGSGQICAVCGESEPACAGTCSESPTYDACPDCEDEGEIDTETEVVR